MWRRLADWCLPAGTFPRWLTRRDDVVVERRGDKWEVAVMPLTFPTGAWHEVKIIERP